MAKDFEQNPGGGSLFENDRKQKDSHPDFTGSYKHHDGTEFWVSGWKHRSKSGKKYLSFSMTAKEAIDEPEQESVPDKKGGKGKNSNNADKW